MVPQNRYQGTHGFQSLSGFLVRCDLKLYHLPIVYQEVSIPVGFSRSLRLYHLTSVLKRELGFNPCRVFSFAATGMLLLRISSCQNVSIPVGFSRSLRLINYCVSQVDGAVFQSLSGFLVRCDMARSRLAGLSRASFQSLSGFLVRCDSRMTRWAQLCRFGFNPCRVFSFAATLRCFHPCPDKIGFNPCRVFSFAATINFIGY